MKIEINELVEAVKEEICCYEDMEKVALQWEKEFRFWLKKVKDRRDVIEDKGKKFLRVKDEDEVFEIAESYIEALEEKSVKNYWEKF